MKHPRRAVLCAVLVCATVAFAQKDDKKDDKTAKNDAAEAGPGVARGDCPQAIQAYPVPGAFDLHY